MRCPDCGTDNREDRKFCSSCGASLAITCRACGSPNEPGERFCGECGAGLVVPAVAEGAEVATHPTPTEEERRLVTVLFADLAGFTSMSESMDPEAVKALAGHCAGLMSEEVRRFGGTVSSVMGDAIMALFGAPVSHEDDPERAVRAAVAMQERIAAVEGAPKKLELHVGINTGEAMAGLIGPDEARDYTAMGDTTNTAARLMGAAPTGSIYIGKETYLATRHSVGSRSVDPIAAKGKAEPVAVWQVVEVSHVPTERPVGSTPLMGREDELMELLEVWAGVRRDRRPARVLVVGPPGIGKTRLLGEFLERIDDGSRFLRGRCLPYGEGITYWPVVEMLKGSAGILHDDDEATTSRKLGTLIQRLPTDDQDELRTIATALATLVAVPSAPGATYKAAAITQGELHWGIRRLFQLRAEQDPLILLFEDLHWAEPTLLELVDHVTDDTASPLLLLGTARPELADTWEGSDRNGNQRLIRLQALTAEQSESLITTLVPGRALAEGPLDAVLRSAAGNPLFLEETVRMLIDAGMLDARGVHLDEEGQGVPVPGSIQGLIDSRLDLLPPDDRRLAQLASVGGLVFWSGLVTHLRGEGNGVLEAMARLEVRDLVHAHLESSIADEREFAFKHALIRDVAYGRLPKRQRSELHARCADWVLRLPGSAEDLIEIVAYHLESACILARELGLGAPSAPLWPAAEALARAAEKAERREGTAEADRFYARALDLIGEEETEAVTEIRLRRSRTLVALGRSEEAIQILRRVADEAVPLGRLDLRGWALVGLANVLQKLGRAAEAKRHVTDSGAIAAQVADPRLEVKTAYETAEIRADFEGQADAALDDLRLGLATADAMDDLSLRIEGHLRLGTVLASVGRLTEAKVELGRCAELADQTGSYRDDARAAYLLAHVEYYLGNPEEADRLATRASDWLERTGDRYFQIQNLLLLSRFSLTHGDLETAMGWVRQALPPAQVLGGWLLVDTCRCLVEVLVLQGSVVEAREFATIAAEVAPKEDAYALAESLLARSLVEAAEWNCSGTASAGEAMQLLEEQGLPIDLAEARISSARVLALRGDRAEAIRLLERVLTSVQRTEARMLLTVADEMLTWLGQVRS